MYLREIKKGSRKKITYTKGSTVFGIFKDFEIRQMQTLDEIVGKDAEYDLIKQDVQGAEIMVMDGAPEIFKRAKYVIQEVNIQKDEAFPDMPCESDMDDYMTSLGFKNNLVIEETKVIDDLSFKIKRRSDGKHIYKEIKFQDKKDYFFEEKVMDLSLNDFENYLKRYNLKIIKTFGDYNLNEFDIKNSERLVMVIKKSQP